MAKHRGQRVQPGREGGVDEDDIGFRLFASVANDRTQSLQHTLHRLWREGAECLDDTALGKGKDLVDPDPGRSGESPLNQVCLLHRQCLLLLLDSGDREPDKISVAIGRGQHHDGTLFR